MNKLNARLTPLILLVLSLFCDPPCVAGGEGPLHQDASNYFEQNLAPLLIKEKLCDSFQDCTYRHRFYFFAISLNDTIHFDVYGITDEKIIKEILLSMLNSGLRISKIDFWQSKYDEKSFFEKPILELIDHSGGK